VASAAPIPSESPRSDFGPRMVRVPEGNFQMGSEIGQDNERPVHRVWIDAFELSACQVTNADYAQFLEANEQPKPPHWDDLKFNQPNQPVVATSWFDASAYCSWLTRVTGRHYRLPSEAEWERAARGGVEGKAFPWGDEPPESLLDYHLRWVHGPEPVGRSTPNPYGLFEMCENVHEWCADWYDAEYYSEHPEKNPRGPAEGSRRSSRGGSWRHYIRVSRCAARSSIPPGFKYADYGFRVARDIEK
jgi:formylglycine-generating enzyme